MAERVYTIKLTSKELWEVMNTFGAGFESGHADNGVADSAMNKLREAWDKVPRK